MRDCDSPQSSLPGSRKRCISVYSRDINLEKDGKLPVIVAKKNTSFSFHSSVESPNKDNKLEVWNNGNTYEIRYFIDGKYSGSNTVYGIKCVTKEIGNWKSRI